MALIIVVLVCHSLRSGLSVDKPGKLQHLFEAIYNFQLEQADEIIGHHEGPEICCLRGNFVHFHSVRKPDRRDSFV